MAINIKELFNSDADNIRLDKVNYNFDQISANGGGPKGVKGEQGFTGNSGQKGEQGTEGPKGDEGAKGDEGIAAQLWYSDTKQVAVGGMTNNLDVITPYSNDSLNSLRTRVIIGEKVTQSNLYSTTISPDNLALLNLVAPEVGSGDVSTQLSFKNDEPNGTPSDFKIFSEYAQGVGSSLKISGHSSSASGEKTNIKILAPNDVLIKSDDGGQMEFKDGNTEFYTPQSFKITSGTTPSLDPNAPANTPTCVFQMPDDSSFPRWYMYRKDNSDIQIGLKNNGTALGNSPATRHVYIEGQNITTSSVTDTNLYSEDEILLNSVNKTTVRSDNEISITSPGDINIKTDNIGASNGGKVQISSELPYDLSAVDYGVKVHGTHAVNISAKSVLLLDTTQSNSIVRIVGGHSSNGRIELNLGQGNGDQKLEIRSDITNSYNTILFTRDGRSFDGLGDTSIGVVGYSATTWSTSLTGVDLGNGIQFPLGDEENPTGNEYGYMAGHYAAPNSATSNNPEARTLSDYFFQDELQQPIYPSRIATSTGGGITNAPTGSPVPLALDTSATETGSAGYVSKVSYIKIGNSVQVNGHILMRSHTTWKDMFKNGSLNNNKFALSFEKEFPYKNNSTVPVYVNIMLDTQFDNDIKRYYHNSVDANGNANGPKTLSADNNHMGMIGVIYPGSNTIFLYQQVLRKVYSSPGHHADGYIRSIDWVSMTPNDLSTDDGTQFVTIGFSFTMFTKWNSFYRLAEAGLTLGGMFSDRNLKTNIVKIGESPSGYNIYEFNFIDNLPEYVIENLGGDPKGLVFQGVIADELPSEFVVRLPDEEFDRVKYGAIDVEFKTVR